MSASYTMLMPFLPLYIRTDLNAQNEDVAFWSSITYAVTFAISAFVSPLWGKLADRMGKKHMMIRSYYIFTPILYHLMIYKKDLMNLFQIMNTIILIKMLLLII